jgi:hypothetical protein
MLVRSKDNWNLKLDAYLKNIVKVVICSFIGPNGNLTSNITRRIDHL